MISLVLRGKLAVSEDVLTAVVFDEIRGRRSSDLLGALLAGAHPAVAAARLPAFVDLEVELWPRTRAGEPDVRVRLDCADGTSAVLLIEAKLGAGKSGVGPVSPDRSKGDQPARYLLAETEERHDARVFLLYLTDHAYVPAEDLAATVKHLRDAGRPDLAERLFWRSWRDVARCFTGTEIGEVFKRVALYRFAGFDPRELAPAASALFYRRTVSRAASGLPCSGDRMPLRLAGPSSAWTYRGVVEAARREYAWPPAQRSTMQPAFYGG